MLRLPAALAAGGAGRHPVIVARLERVLAFGKLLATAAALGSCGPGLESLHEGSLRFEHCYRLDMDPKIAPSHRRHCWRDWHRAYAYEQPLDRIDYARRRIIALESGDHRLQLIREETPRHRVFSEVNPGDGDDAPMVAPAPTSAHAPPPLIAPAAPQPPAAPPAAGGPDDPLPGSKCTAACESAFRKCSGSCRPDEWSCAQCREDYSTCMRRCFE